MAVHGVSRSTRDLDLLTVDMACLEPEVWSALAGEGIAAAVRRGDADDPLAGAVRFTSAAASPLDLIVGRSAWQARVIRRARAATVEGVDVPVAGRVDLILLKLYAGGPLDAWDVEQLLMSPDRATLMADVEANVGDLPSDARRLWGRVCAGA